MALDDNRFDTTEPAGTDISPYDVSYPVAILRTGISRELQRAQIAAQSIFRAVIEEMPIIAQIQQATDKGIRYVVDVSENTLQALESGALKFVQENGHTYAQLREHGRYSTKLPIKKEIWGHDIDPVQMANALQMQALQDQLQSIAAQLLLIDGSVREVLQGQQNDRIGLYYSGLALFLEAKGVTSDAGFKNALLAQALRSLAESTFQLKLTMQSDIRYIEQKEYDKAKGKRKELILGRMNSINQSFAYIHQAMMLRAAIYCDIGELGSMARVLEEYSRFIDNDISSKAPLLSQYDINDDGTPNGLWASRSQLKLDTSEISKALNSPQKVLYLSVAKEKTKE